MSNGLLEQIDAYFSDIDADQGPVTSEQVAEHLENVRVYPVALKPAPRNSRIWVALAAFAGVLALVGVVAWLAPPGTRVPVGTDPPGTSVPVGTDPPEGSTADPAVAQGLEVNWSQAQWDTGEGPLVGDIVGASSLLLGTDRGGRLWRSSNGVNWERILDDLAGISISADESLMLVAGQRIDGTTALLRSDDGSTWTEVDHSALDLGNGFTVVKTTPSGLTWFGTRAQDGSGAGVLAVVSGDLITEVHDPPWDPEPCCGVTDLFEVGGNIAAYQFDRNEPQFSHAWEYLGSGKWSEIIEVTFGSDRAVVGETVLMFDQTNATCCFNPIPGTSFWPLLSSDDGINWSEVAQIPGNNVHTLHVNAGSSFWIYGPILRGGGSDIEVNSDTNIWISEDGVTWHDIDTSQVDVTFIAEPRTGSVHVAGNTIFLFNETAYEGTGEYWVGTIDAE